MRLKGLEKGVGKEVRSAHISVLKINCSWYHLFFLFPAWLHGNQVCSKQLIWNFVYSQIKPLDKKALDLFLVHRDSFYKHRRKEP